MSRRQPNPSEQRATQNTATIKSLLKLEGNKVCADCKRNKHPRWASWNLGIFVCIRCSGIHRGMGTHISRVKSVDLDAWTDEQLQSVLQWGNARANKYWEAKLAAGHVPSEAKIENFIRTKYESKRWVMEGGMPDPSTLDAEGDDDIPLNLVKEKHNIERSTSQKELTGPTSGHSQFKRAPQQDLFGDEPIPRPSSMPKKPALKSDLAPPRQTKPADSLLGLDFLGSEATPPSRPNSTTPTVGTQSRPDLKQSILSLYASTPKPQPSQPSSQATTDSLGGMQNLQSTQSSSLGGIDDAFSSLSFSNSSAKPSAFSGLGSMSTNQYKTAQTSSPPPLTGGSFFDAKAAPPSQQHNRGMSSSSGFGAFNSAPGPVSDTKASSALGDLFDFSTPVQTQSPPKQTMAISSPPEATSVFNLSAQPTAQAKPQAPVETMTGWSGTDTWGSNDVWNNAKPSPPTTKAAPAHTNSGDFGGWESGGSLANQSIVPGGGGGFSTTSSIPKVSADEDFGGWSSAAPESSGTPAAVPKPAPGFGGSDDLFSNVWE